jgi:ferric-dicitrate binding protein FerR (iron transport regulator)
MKAAAIILCAALLSGCTTRIIEYQGVRYTSETRFTDQSIGRLRIKLPDGTEVELDGYSNDGAAALGVAVEAAVSAAVKGAK